MEEILKEIERIGIIPVVVLEDENKALLLARALIKGGLPCAEVTFRTEAAEAAIRLMSERYPEMLVGAGTVLTIQQVDQAVNAGAKFIVSPGFNPKIVKYCQSNNILIIPGCSNPSDIEQALELGLKVVKFFPAEAAGGLSMLRAMAAPYKGVRFMPTGGITGDNMLSYLADKRVVACGGSWMVGNQLIEIEDFDTITRMTKEAIQKMLGFEVKHLGMNCQNEIDALQTAREFNETFGFSFSSGNRSIFASNMIEIMKEPYFGEQGHIAIGTNFIERAIVFLEKQGYQFKEESIQYKNDRINVIYMKQEINGFAIHLIQK